MLIIRTKFSSGKVITTTKKMMKNYDESVEINHNPNWPYIPDHPCRILIIGGSGSGNTNVSLNLIKHQRPEFDKNYLYIKDPFESNYQLLINRREKVGIKTLEDYNPKKKRKVLIVFDDKITDMEANKKWSLIITESFLRGRKRNISLAFISQSYFKVPKTIRLNVTYYFIWKIPNKREFQQIASNHSSDTELKDFMKLYQAYTKEPFSFLVSDTT